MKFFSRFCRIKILIVLVLTFTLLSSIALASQLDDKRLELQNIQEQIQANKNMQATVDKQQSDILKQIQDNDQAIAQLQAQIVNLQSELDRTISDRKAAEAKLSELQAMLDKAQAELAANQAKLEAKRKAFNKRLVSMYKSQTPQIVAVLVNSKNLGDLIDRSAFVGMVTQNDAKLISELRDLIRVTSEKIAQINTEKKNIDAQRLNLARQEQRITEVKNQLADKQKQLQNEQSKQQVLLTRAQQQKVELEQAEDALVATSSALTNQIKVLEQQGGGDSSDIAALPRSSASYNSSAKRGLFIYPVIAPITSRFGMRFHPILGYAKMHTGLDLGAAWGTPVHAAASGKVIIAGWAGGYGYAVIIDHGNGLTTLYGHNSKLVVHAGQYVSQGQVISYSGSTGLSTGPHLHFEVRKNGNPVNPLQYVGTSN